MSDAVRQNVGTGALIDGQIQVNFGDGNIAKGIAQLDEVDVAVLNRAFSLSIFADHALKLVIVGFRRLLDGVNFLALEGTHGLLVFLNRHGGIPVCQRVAHKGVRKNGGAGDHHQDGKNDYDVSGFGHNKLL